MIKTFKVAEDMESVEDLHALCSLMQTIRAFVYSPCHATAADFIYLFLVMIHDHGLYEHILNDAVFFGAVGMLECMLPVVSVCHLKLNLPYLVQR